MQKAFEKTKESLEEKVKVTSLEMIVTGTKDKHYFEIKYKEVGKEDYHIGYSSYDLKKVFDWKEERFEIVNQVAEEYKRTAHYGCNTNGEHEKCDDCSVADKCPNYKKQLFDQFGNSEQVAVKYVSDINVGRNDGWIPVEQRLPETDEYILISFENFTVPIIGRYQEDENGGAFYAGDEDETLVSQEMFVNAWMPIKAYRSEIKRINGDKIRSMSNTELTEIILCPYDTAGEPEDIMPCIMETGTQELVSKGKCKECMMKWLERECS